MMIFAPLLAAAALSGTAVVDKTVSCQVIVQAGVPILTVRASPVSTFIGTDGKRGFLTAGLWVSDNYRNFSGIDLLGAANVAGGLATPPTTLCKPTGIIPLSHVGIPREGVYTKYSDGLGNGEGARCALATRATIRLRTTVLGGIPVAAQLAIRSGRKQRPVAYVDWTPKKVTTYLTSDCQS